MVDPTTPNLVLAQPLRGTDVGTWDVPVNGNMGIIDQAFGGVTVVTLSSVGVVLASSQAQNSIIRITGTLTVNGVGITLPSIYKGWTIDNQLTNSLSSFAVVISSTGGTSLIGIAPGVNDIFYDGTTVKYRNLGRIGEYWDYAGPTVPTWVTNCTIPPYLNCNGSAFSSATYPILANSLGTTTLPDSRGRYRASLNQGTARINTSPGGVDGNTILAGGGADGITLLTSQIPAHSHPNALSDPGHAHSYTKPSNSGNTGGGGSFGNLPVGDITGSATTGISIINANAGGGGTHANLPPSYVGGITMIRAA